MKTLTTKKNTKSVTLIIYQMYCEQAAVYLAPEHDNNHVEHSTHTPALHIATPG